MKLMSPNETARLQAQWQANVTRWLQWVPIGLIDIDPKYQRRRNKRVIKNVATAFNDFLWGVVVLNKRDGGRYAAVDGGNRVTGLKEAGYTGVVLAFVEDDMTVAQEAKLLVDINTLRSSMAPRDVYKAGLVAGTEPHASIAAMLNKYGLVMAESDCSSASRARQGQITCLWALQKVFGGADGPAALDRVLQVICLAYGDSVCRTNQTMFMAISRAIERDPGSRTLRHLAENLSAAKWSWVENEAGRLKKVDLNRQPVPIKETDEHYLCEAVRKLWHKRTASLAQKL